MYSFMLCRDIFPLCSIIFLLFNTYQILNNRTTLYIHLNFGATYALHHLYTTSLDLRIGPSMLVRTTKKPAQLFVYGKFINRCSVDSRTSFPQQQ